MRNFEKLWILYFRKSYIHCISLINKDKIIVKNEDLAKASSNFFSIVKKLDIENVPDDESNSINADDPILKAIAKC